MAHVTDDANNLPKELGSCKSSHKNNVQTVQTSSKRIKLESMESTLEIYLKLRNYNYKVENGKIMIPEEKTVELSTKESSTIKKLVANNNSIVYSYVNIDAHMLEDVNKEFSRLLQFILNLQNSVIKEELHMIIPVMLCHLYLEILKGVGKPTALAFLEKHSPSFFQTEPATEGHYELLSQLKSITTIQEISTQPLLSLFRSSKHITNISLETSTILRKFLAKYGHSILIHILNKWFHYEIKSGEMKNHEKFKESDAYLTNVEQKGYSDDLKELVNNLKKIKLTRVTNLLNADGVTCAVSDNRTLAKAVGLINSEIVLLRNNVDFIELDQCSADDNSRLEVQHVKGHGDAVTNLKFTAQGQLLLSCSQDESVRLWNMSNGEMLNIYNGHQNPIWSLDVSPNEQYFVTGSFDCTGRLWSLERKHPFRIFIGHSQSVHAVSFHKNGKYIATGSRDTSVRLFSITDAGILRLMNEPTSTVYSVAFSPDGKMLAGACEEGDIYIWDLAKGSCLYKLTGHTGPINCLTWDNDISSNKLYTGTINGEVKIWIRQNESWESHDLYLEGSYKRIINVELIPSQSGPHIFAVPFNNSNKY